MFILHLKTGKNVSNLHPAIQSSHAAAPVQTHAFDMCYPSDYHA
jgi:hypothetical protein